MTINHTHTPKFAVGDDAWLYGHRDTAIRIIGVQSVTALDGTTRMYYITQCMCVDDVEPVNPLIELAEVDITDRLYMTADELTDYMIAHSYTHQYMARILASTGEAEHDAD